MPQDQSERGRLQPSSSPSAANVVLGAECLRLNPSDGTVASRVPAMRAADARKLANRAALAFLGWSTRPASERAAILQRAADLIEQHRGDLGALMRDEIGATRAWQDFNVDQACAQFRAAADLAEKLASETLPDPSGRNRILREPAGVCLGIAPWNAPLALGARAVATGLACGNAMILKASEICAGSHFALGDILAEAGLPEGVLSIVTHAPDAAHEVVEALISHDVVRRVSFTGSTRVGKMVAEMAARSLKRCLLALSGKATLVVLEDADLEAASDAALYGAFLNQGQICMSTDRIVIADRIADAFLDRLVAKAANITAGPPDRAPIGPVISEMAARRLADLIADARSKGARLLIGGDIRGTYMDATILDHVAPGMRAYHEELFGPLVTICRAGSEEEMISLVNDSDFGLVTAIWSGDTARAQDLAHQVESGMCHINAPTVLDDPAMPVGGMKQSGFGRFGVSAALDEYTELRWQSLGTTSASMGAFSP